VNSLWQKAQTAVAAPFESFFVFPSTFHVLFLALTFLVSVVVYAARARRPFRLSAIRRFVLPRRIFLHRSAKLDYQYYPLMTMLRAGMLGGMAVSSSATASFVLQSLRTVFGAMPPLAAPHWLLIVLVTVLQVVMFDLGYWIGHRIMHQIPLLWEFHKTHHAAEVLTPATAARSHPVDDLIQTNFIAAALGVGYGLLVYAFGEGAQPLSLLGTNVLFFFYFLTLFHLRHSHVWLPIRGWLGYIIQSPAHHQIHHSTHPRHYNKNLGFCLSLWDWIFGTLYVPDKREAIEFGLGEENADFASLKDLFLRPFINVARTAIRAVAKAPPVAEVERKS
jgi:sterol desaturase/sphingolipid hydroxylase (fatty acid hydroxylase superfamily)